ncbi:MAG: hypothetical protein WBH51_01440 [Mycolicibacter algericus]|uniref:hypothetical protein n=1 Tax=Mycolicibacter algericus TaxID=1288388 RepID=UPI003C71F1CE
MKVTIAFDLDIDEEGWLDHCPEDAGMVAEQAANHAEAVIRDLYYDNGWITEHHPLDHPRRAVCGWCKE